MFKPGDKAIVVGKQEFRHHFTLFTSVTVKRQHEIYGSTVVVAEGIYKPNGRLLTQLVGPSDLKPVLKGA